jgi:aspartate/methionine/tyrosine aminotransferase
MNLSQRMQAIQTPIIPIVGDLIRRHPGTISLGQGVVHYGPPPEALQRIHDFWADPQNHKYQPVVGIAPLREALWKKLDAENGICPGQGSEVVVTAGGNMAFVNAILAITDPGDEILLPLPFYFNHEMAVVMADCTPVLVPTDENYQLRLGLIEQAITARTRAIVTVSPNNPSGAVYPASDLQAVNDLCRARGIYHINDEAYEYFTYGDARHFSPGSLPGGAAHTISLFSLSKAYGFASWRIGYMTVPEHLLDPVRKIQDTILICPPVISQYAALGALEAGKAYCREHLIALEGVRDQVGRELKKLEPLCTLPPAGGAFYFLVRVNLPMNPMALVERLIREYRVAVIPGTAFGLEDVCTLRVAYGALQKETISEGIGRLVKGLSDILGGHVA